MTTLFRDLPVVNWFMVTNFHDNDYLKEIQETYNLMDWFAVRHICND